MTLIDLGWDDEFQQDFLPFKDQGLVPARVVRQERNSFQLGLGEEILTGVLAGKSRDIETSQMVRPVTGDWVAVRRLAGEDKGIIEAILPRRTELSRQGAGERTERQVLAANMDVVFVVMAADEDFNLARLERYLAMVWESGAEPVVLLNKVDLSTDVDDLVEQIAEVAIGVPVYPIAAKTGQGLAAVEVYLKQGKTIACVGMSGVGKSTLINTMLGEELQATATVRESDGRGRHTTTQRELLVMPGRGLMLDTPGLRQLGQWQSEGTDEAVATTFADIDTLAEMCKFRDCAHETEPGCAVRAAIETGEIGQAHLDNYRKLGREGLVQLAKQDKAAASKQNRQRRNFSKMVRGKTKKSPKR